MWWCMLAFVVVMVALFVGASALGSEENSLSGLSPEAKERAWAMADKVDTMAKFRTLERRLEKAEVRDNEQRHETLQAAVDLAAEKGHL